MLKAINITKSFNGKMALKDVSFQVSKGEIFCLFKVFAYIVDLKIALSIFGIGSNALIIIEKNHLVLSSGVLPVISKLRIFGHSFLPRIFDIGSSLSLFTFTR